jgi:hypothetical protein
MDAVANQAAPLPLCRSCQAEIGAADRFCRACGASLMPAGAEQSAKKKIGRKVAAAMFLAGVAILLFAAIHRNPADIILVIAFGLPLCGAGALSWRTP